MRLGDFELLPLSDGSFRLDGGAMFGVVPRTLWAKRTTPDDRNRIPLGLRPLLLRTPSHTVIIDAGIGDKMHGKALDIYGVERDRHLDHALASAGLTAADIDVVIASHLHFDHAGGFTVLAGGVVRPRFPRARYIVRRGEWEDATHPHERNRASYFADDFMPLADAKVIEFVEEDTEVLPGVRVRRTGGHTRHHQIIQMDSGGKTAVFAADLIPTVAHLDVPWIMAYDLYPMETLAFKREFVREAIEGEYVIFFEHDPTLAAGIIRETDGRRWVEPLVPAS